MLCCGLRTTRTNEPTGSEAGIMIPSVKEIIFLGATLLAAIALLCLVAAIIVGGFAILRRPTKRKDD